MERTLGRLNGVRTVEANPVAQTATVSYDPAETNVAELRRWVEECGYHCDGQSVPGHVCHPMQEPATAGHASSSGAGAGGEGGAGTKAPPSAHDMMGHGGHGSRSMADMWCGASSPAGR